MPTFCPVCGYDLALTDPDALPEPCSCCAFDFEHFDKPESYNYFVKEDPFDMASDVWRDGWREFHLRLTTSPAFTSLPAWQPR